MIAKLQFYMTLEVVKGWFTLEIFVSIGVKQTIILSYDDQTKF